MSLFSVVPQGTTLQELHEKIHLNGKGMEYKVGARLWYRLDGFDTVLMVEYKMATKERREQAKADDLGDEPDWLEIYGVAAEGDSHIIATINTNIGKPFCVQTSEPIYPEVTESELKARMEAFAKNTCQRLQRGRYILLECNCQTEETFRAMLDETHQADAGFNFEIGARLWYSPHGSSEVIMVEYQISTKTLKKIVENEDEPDWLTAYAVTQIGNTSVDNELSTTPIDNVSLKELKDTMVAFALETAETTYEPEAPPKSEIRVPIAGGTIVAERNPDPNYDGLTIFFQTDSGDIVDLVLVESKSENERKNIEVYNYDDVYSEDYTRKTTVLVKDIYEALDLGELPTANHTVQGSEYEDIEDILTEKISNDSTQNIEESLDHPVSAEIMEELDEKI